MAFRLASCVVHTCRPHIGLLRAPLGVCHLTQTMGLRSAEARDHGAIHPWHTAPNVPSPAEVSLPLRGATISGNVSSAMREYVPQYTLCLLCPARTNILQNDFLHGVYVIYKKRLPFLHHQPRRPTIFYTTCPLQRRARCSGKSSLSWWRTSPAY